MCIYIYVRVCMFNGMVSAIPHTCVAYWETAGFCIHKASVCDIRSHRDLVCSFGG